jgi:CHAD domain-containing protein
MPLRRHAQDASALVGAPANYRGSRFYPHWIRSNILNFELQASADRLEALRSALLAGYSDEGLHQLRVTLRRMRSFLRGRPGGKARDLRQQLGALACATNSARDWDTLAAGAGGLLRPEQHRALQALLQDCRETAHAQVYRMLHSHQWLATLRGWQAFVQATGVEPDSRDIAPGDLGNKLQRAAAAGHKALARDDDRSWHKLRIAIKELRYHLDTFNLDTLAHRPRHPVTAGLLDECKTLQALLGDWHDTVIHRQLLDGLAGQGLLEPATPAGKAATAMLQALVAKGRQSLEQVRHRLRQGQLESMADGLAAGA